MSELCSVPRVSERFAQSNALDEDIARLKYVSGKREEPFAVWEFGRWGTSFSISLIDISTYALLVHRDGAHRYRLHDCRHGRSYRSKAASPAYAGDRVSLVDETGVLQVAFFRQPWIAQQFKQGDRLAVMGKVEFAYGFKQMASPHFEKLEEGRAAGTILPVHYVSDGVSQAWMRRIVSGALEVVGNPFDRFPPAYAPSAA